MSEIKLVETQGCASPIKGLTRVAVLCSAPDGWRVYEAMHVLRTGEHWDQDRADAVVWTHKYGNKLRREEARRYFNIPDTMKLVA